MFYDNFIEICNENGVSPTRVLVALEISRGNLTRWKNGVEPRNEIKKKIADYFNIPIRSLGESEAEKHSDGSISQEELKRIISLMTQNEKAAIQLDDSLKIMNMIDKLNKQQREAITLLIQSMLTDK